MKSNEVNYFLLRPSFSIIFGQLQTRPAKWYCRPHISIAGIVAREMCQRNRNRIQSVVVIVSCIVVLSALSWSNGQKINQQSTTRQQHSNVRLKVSTSIVQSTSTGPVLMSITGHTVNQQIVAQNLSSRETQSDRVVDRARRLTSSNEDALPDYQLNGNNVRAQQYHYQPLSDRGDHHGQQRATYQRPLKYETTDTTDNKRLPNAGGRILDLSRSIVPMTGGYKQSITTSLNFAPDIRYVIPYISQLNQLTHQQSSPRYSSYASPAASNVINNRQLMANQINDLSESMYFKKLKQEQQQCRRRGFVGIIEGKSVSTIRTPTVDCEQD